ncbi:MAG: MotA/TolQ/ExbB proton channel family protein [Maricaulaceae bacterium]|nr:MotA/TolQ/ExbB proton channel family protein [Maricaulaceae bacterium]
MKTVVKIFAAVSLGAALTAGAMAQDRPRQTEPVASISELLNRVRQDTREASAENQRRIAEFRQARDQQQGLLSNARAQLSALVGEANRLTQEYESNRETVAELDAQLRAAQGEFGELFGASRQSAGDFGSLIQASVVSAQYPGRHTALTDLSESRTLPSRNELDFIWRRITEEMIYQGEVSRYQAVVTGLNRSEPVDMVRVGAFLNFAVTGGSAEFVAWSPDEDTGIYRLTRLDRQPPGNITAAAAALARASEGSVVMGPVDPSRGALLAIYREFPTLQERIDQGRLVGRVILGLLAFSALFGLWRLFVLFTTSSAVAAQKRRSSASKGNPLGRVMLAYEEVKTRDIETIELKLDEAILRESPKLEFGLNFLKLAAGVAPLLGLLGTVTGMIRTFTQITLFGTGDPRVMAGGISEALVTTVLGLVSAIPLLFIHSFAQSFARGVQQVLEEQAAGMVARAAEERSGGGKGR